MTDLFRQAGWRRGPNRIFGGWTLSGNIFFRTGLPFTVIDTTATNTLEGFGYGVPGGQRATPFVFASPVTTTPRFSSRSAMIGLARMVSRR